MGIVRTGAPGSARPIFSAGTDARLGSRRPVQRGTARGQIGAVTRLGSERALTPVAAKPVLGAPYAATLKLRGSIRRGAAFIFVSTGSCLRSTLTGTPRAARPRFAARGFARATVRRTRGTCFPKLAGKIAAGNLFARAGNFWFTKIRAAAVFISTSPKLLAIQAVRPFRTVPGRSARRWWTRWGRHASRLVQKIDAKTGNHDECKRDEKNIRRPHGVALKEIIAQFLSTRVLLFPYGKPKSRGS